MAELVIHGWECAGTRSTGMHVMRTARDVPVCSGFAWVADRMPPSPQGHHSGQPPRSAEGPTLLELHWNGQRDCRWPEGSHHPQ